MKKKLLVIMLLFSSAFGLWTFAVEEADPLRAGLDNAAKVGNVLPANNEETGTTMAAAKIGSALGGLLQLIGVVFMVLIIYGGILYMTAGGEQAQIDKGKKFVVNAAIGLALIAMAYAATAYIVGIAIKIPS